MINIDPPSLLPDVFKRSLSNESSKSTVLNVLLSVMEAMHEPIKKEFKQIERDFNPYHTNSDEFVEYLATWVDLDRLWSSGLHQDSLENKATKRNNLIDNVNLRELIAHASLLCQWRGTPYGMSMFLKLATGCQDIEIIEGKAINPPRSFHFRVCVPEDAKPKMTLIKTIIEQEKPVYTTFDIS